MPDHPPDLHLHASCVALGDRAVLLTGPSGSGKSALALQLMALGAILVADDRVIVTRRGPRLHATCPPAIRGRIEARHVGILHARCRRTAPLALAVDLGTPETDRLPPRRSTNVLGLPIPLLHNIDKPHFPAAILQYLRQGRSD